MDSKVLQKLVDQARKDPKFVHAMVFDPESILKQVDFLDRNTRARLIANSPEEVIAGIIGSRGITAAAQDYAP
jgi:hypothetical protein